MAPRPAHGLLALLLAGIVLSGTVQARSLKEEQGRHLSELPPSIVCPESKLLSAEVADPAYACSPAYYNCLGVPVGGVGPLSYCQDGLVFDKTFPYSDASPVPATQGGACNYNTPACGPSSTAASPAGAQPVYPGHSGQPSGTVQPAATVYPGQSGQPYVQPAAQCQLANYACVDNLHFCLGGYSMLCAPGTVCKIPAPGQSPCMFP